MVNLVILYFYFDHFVSEPTDSACDNKSVCVGTPNVEKILQYASPGMCPPNLSWLFVGHPPSLCINIINGVLRASVEDLLLCGYRQSQS